MASPASGARRLAQSVRHGLDADVPREMGGHEEYAANDEAGEAGQQPFMLEDLCRWDGNIAELFNDSEDGKRKLAELGATIIREFELDKSGRRDWEESAKNALAAAGQKKGEKKTYPFTGAANIKFPILTAASIQFAARAYPNIVRGDEVVAIKVSGEDGDSAKADRGERVAAFCNDQLLYQCPEWETGTDALLHQLPITGAGFRKCYWDANLNRPRFDYAPALKVFIPVDAPSLELSPRVSHILDAIYPHDYEKRVANGVWLKCEIKSNTQDSQAPITFIEQCRYIDMDDDGLSEPYIVVVHKDTSAVVRIDPAFDCEDIKRKPPGPDGAPGAIQCVERLLPWVEYTFLPDPEGGAYGIGFGKLLEAISETINTLLNQMIDAGHWSNTNTGFIGAGFAPRSGEISLEPNVFKMLDGVQNVREAIQRLEFAGPSQVSFQLVEMLLGAAADITAIKDVLAGEMPGGQHVAEGTVMALIEQGLQVFTSIYKRIYRSMRKEFELLCKLNARYLDPAQYQAFLDAMPPKPQQQTDPSMAQSAPPPGIGHNGGPPLGPDDMGGSANPGEMRQMPANAGADQPDMGGQPQAPAPEQMGGPMPQPMGGDVVPFPGPQGPPAILYQPAQEFSLADMDIRPVADPTAITDMQRMARAQWLGSMMEDPLINRAEVRKFQLEAARIPNRDRFLVERNPAMEEQMAMQKAMAQVELANRQAEGARTAAETDKINSETETAKANTERALAQKDRELEQRDRELALQMQRSSFDDYRADMDAADREVQLILEQAKLAGDDDHRRELTDLEREKLDVARVAAAAKGEAVKAKASRPKPASAQPAASSADSSAEIAKLAASIQQMSAQSQEKIADAIGKMLTGVADSNSQIAAGLKAMAESIERSNKIALAPTELVKGPDGRPAGSKKVIA